MALVRPAGQSIRGQTPMPPLKSARRPRPGRLNSSGMSDSGGSEDGHSPRPSIAFSVDNPEASSFVSIRNSLWSPAMGKQSHHAKQSSFSSTNSDRSVDSNRSERSSFEWDSLDTTISSLIEAGARLDHRDAALTYKVSRQTRRMLRVQRQVSLQETLQ